MSQLVVRPGRNAAREAKRLKEVRKVKGAILWNQKEREKRQKLFQERYESKQAVIQRIRWDNENVKKVRKKALDNAKEDWKLGPLRPNRAIGAAAEKYGALTSEQMQKPEIPVHTQRNRNETRAKQNLEPTYPLVVDNEKYFHIAKNDRVVVIKGREKGKIGLVQSIIERTHEVIVTGVNMQYYDSDAFNTIGEDMGPKRPNEVPFPLDDIRLVVPYEVLESVYVKDGGEMIEEKVKTYRDVIVDKIFMERHTTGIDPFTGTDYGESEIPKEHQYDPKTGLPIFHRYIAGTRERIDWPQEKREKKDSSLTPEDQEAKESWIKKTLGTIRHPISSFKSWKSQTPKVSNSNQPKVPRQSKVLTEAEKAQRAANRVARRAARREQLALIERLREEARQARRVVKPRSQKLEETATFDADTTRNIVGGAESMTYNLVAPPFPDSLGEELRSHIKDLASELRRNKDDNTPLAKRMKRVTERGLIASELAKAKHAAAQKMKTPMQLRWETEHAKKIKQQKTAPLVSTDELMAALGKHIKQARKQKTSAQAEELD